MRHRHKLPAMLARLFIFDFHSSALIDTSRVCLRWYFSHCYLFTLCIKHVSEDFWLHTMSETLDIILFQPPRMLDLLPRYPCSLTSPSPSTAFLSNSAYLVSLSIAAERMHFSRPLTVCISFLTFTAAAPSSNIACSEDIPRSHIFERGNTLPCRLANRLTTIKGAFENPSVHQLSPSLIPSPPFAGLVPPHTDPYSPLSDSWAAVPNPLPPKHSISTKPRGADRTSAKKTSTLVQRGLGASCSNPGGCRPGRGTLKSFAVAPAYLVLQCDSRHQRECDEVCRCDVAGEIICDRSSREKAQQHYETDVHYHRLMLKARTCRRTCICNNDLSRGSQPPPRSPRRSTSLSGSKSSIPDAALPPAFNKRGSMNSCLKNPKKCRPTAASTTLSLSDPLSDTAQADVAPSTPLSTLTGKAGTSRALPIECRGSNQDYCKHNCDCVGPGRMLCDKRTLAEKERLLQTPWHFLPLNAEAEAEKRQTKITEECKKSCRCEDKSV